MEYEEIKMQLNAFTEENFPLKNELETLKEIERVQKTKRTTQQNQLKTLQAKLEESMAETAKIHN
jgi:hypothetical protein